MFYYKYWNTVVQTVKKLNNHKWIIITVKFNPRWLFRNYPVILQKRRIMEVVPWSRITTNSPWSFSYFKEFLAIFSNNRCFIDIWHRAKSVTVFERTNGTWNDLEQLKTPKLVRIGSENLVKRFKSGFKRSKPVFGMVNGSMHFLISRSVLISCHSFRTRVGS